MEAARLVLGIALFTLILALPVHWLWRRRQAKGAVYWPSTEAIIESGAIEVVAQDQYAKVELPVFAFYYRVEGEYFGGRFALLPYITDPGASIIERMIGRKLQVLYDPEHAESWLIPDDLIEGCRVEQRLSSHMVNLKPLD